MTKWLAVLLLGLTVAACGGAKKGAAGPAASGEPTAGPAETAAPAVTGEATAAATDAPAVPPAK
jgi:hypothetical protein